MRPGRTHGLAIFIALLMSFYAARADALGARQLNVEVAAEGGISTDYLSTRWTPIGGEVGGRAGLIIGKVYAGASYLYLIPGTRPEPAQPLPRAQVRAHMRYGPEVGYDFNVGSMTLRPTLGAGIYEAIVSSFDGVSRPFFEAYIEPAIVVLVREGPLFFGGKLDILFLGLVPLTTWGIEFQGELGLRL